MDSDSKQKPHDFPAEEVREGDGLDPREEKRDRQVTRRRGKPDYSNLRLAAQIQKTLSAAIAQASDSCLHGITIGAVEPSASGSAFVVQAYCADPAVEYDPRHVREVLNAIKPGLRAEVANAVKRKNAPEFTFDVLPPHVRPR